LPIRHACERSTMPSSSNLRWFHASSACLRQVYDQVGCIGQRSSFERPVRRIILQWVMPCWRRKCPLNTGYFVAIRSTRPYVPGSSLRVPEIGAGAHIDPGFRDSHDQTTVAVAEVAFQHNQVIVVIIFTLSSSPLPRYSARIS